MAKPFDVTTKSLVEGHPRDWVRLIGLPDGPATVIDADLSTVTVEADRIIRVEAERGPYLLHLEFQSSDDSRLAERMLRYNVLVRYEHRLPTESVAILLRPSADGNLPGVLTLPEVKGDEPGLAFRYRVLRVWELPAEILLASGLGILPLAPLARDVSEANVSDIVQRMEKRFQESDAAQDEKATLWASTFVLMGLRYSEAIAQQMLGRVQQMRESTTYQAILREGRQEGLQEGLQVGLTEGRATGVRETILSVGRKRFGEPDSAIRQTLNTMHDVERLDALALKLLTAGSWAELLAQ